MKERIIGLESISIKCPNLDKAVEAKKNDLSWYCISQESEYYGTSSLIKVSFACECGKYHDVEVYDD